MSAPSFVVRDACVHDRDAIIEFNSRLAIETEGKTLDLARLARGVARALEDPDRLRYWVVEPAAGGPIVGQAAVTREWSDWRDGWIWWFQSVYVHPDFRRLGLFRALHGHVRELALNAGDVIGLRLYVESENHKAQRTYQSLGMSSGGYHVLEEFWLEGLNQPPG
jgi:GNAT superfamily N-acetyltransferase